MEKHSHLVLPRSASFRRKTRKGGIGYKKTDRDAKKFYETEIKKLDSITSTYKNDKEKYQKYFDPQLIFKINLTNNVSDKSFRDELRRAEIETISSSPNKSGYWVAFTDDIEFKKFRQKLRTGISKDKATFIDMIGGIEEIRPEEKLSASLKERPLARGKPEYLDVEIWRMKDSRLREFISGLSSMVTENHGEVSDRLVTDSFCVLRIKCDFDLLLKITQLRETSHVDRPPQTVIEAKLDAAIEDFKINGPPDQNSPGILLVDSGIKKHPLIEGAIADTIAVSTTDGKIKEPIDIDDVGHGTAIAGIALYGNISKCIDAKEFDPHAWLYSAKVMHSDKSGNAIFDDTSLLENQLKYAVEKTVKKHTRCKIVNISLGNADKKMMSGQRQFRIASLIDELSMKYSDVLFTIASGNNTDDICDHESYPQYLMKDDYRAKIIDPATSAHGITAGSISPYNSGRRKNLGFPSPFTSVGPGLNGMIKPELVEYGGGYSEDLVTINPTWNKDGRLFTMVSGRFCLIIEG